MEPPLRIRAEAAAQVHLGLAGILVLVQPLRRGVPHVDLGALHRVPGAVHHPHVRDQRRPRRRRAHQARPAGAQRAGPRARTGPSRLACVSVWPLSPLLSRQTRAETPSEPAISTTSLCESVVRWPMAAISRVASWNSRSVSRTSRMKPCRCRTSASRISRSSGVRRAAEGFDDGRGDRRLVLDDHVRTYPALQASGYDSNEFARVTQTKGGPANAASIQRTS